MAWKADNIQVVFFTRPGTSQLDALQIWNTVYKDVSPDGFQRGASNPTAVSIAFGSIDKYNVQIQSQLGRVDIIITAPSAENTVSPPVQIVNVQQALRILKDAGLIIITIIKTIRIGIVGNMSELADNKEVIIERVRSEIGHSTFPDGTSDHIYQYNLPKISSDGVTGINRIINFSSGVMQQYRATMGLPGSGMSVVQEFPMVTFKIDINSLPTQDISPVAREVLIDIFDQMDLIVENGIKGIS